MQFLIYDSKETNSCASISHTIFRLIIESSLKAEVVFQNGYLNLVDLPELNDRVHAANMTVTCLIEAVNVQNSRLSLRRIRSQMVEQPDPDSIVHLVNSKRLRILAAPLSGNSMTAIVCNVNGSTSTKKFDSNAESKRQTSVLPFCRPLQETVATVENALHRSNYEHRINAMSEFKATSPELQIELVAAYADATKTILPKMQVYSEQQDQHRSTGQSFPIIHVELEQHGHEMASSGTAVDNRLQTLQFELDNALHYCKQAQLEHEHDLAVHRSAKQWWVSQRFELELKCSDIADTSAAVQRTLKSQLAVQRYALDHKAWQTGRTALEQNSVRLAERLVSAQTALETMQADHRQLKSDYEMASQQLKDAVQSNADLDIMRVDHAQLTNELAAVKYALAEAQQQLHPLQAKCDSLLATVSKYQQQVVTLQAHLVESEPSQTLSARAAVAMAVLLNHQAARLEDTAANNALSQLHAQQQLRDVKALNARLEQKYREVQFDRTENQKLLEQSIVKKLDLEEQCCAQRQQLREIVELASGRQNELEAAQQRLAVAEDALAALQLDYDNVQLLAEHATAEQKRLRMREKRLGDELVASQTEQTRAADELVASSAELRKTQRDCANLVEQLAKARRGSIELQRQLDAMKAEKNELEAVVENDRSVIEQAERECRSMRDTMLVMVNSELQQEQRGDFRVENYISLADQTKCLQVDQMTGLIKQLAALLRADDMRPQDATLTEQFAAVKETTNKASLENGRTVNDDFESLRQQISDQMAELNVQITALKRSNQHHISVVGMHRQELNAHGKFLAELNVVKQSLHDRTRECTQLRLQLSELQTVASERTCASQCNETAGIQAKNHQHTSETHRSELSERFFHEKELKISELETHLQRLNNEDQARRQQNDALRSRNQQMATELNDLRARLERDRKSRRRSAHDDSRTTFNSIQTSQNHESAVDRLKDIIEVLEQENQATRQKYEDLKILLLARNRQVQILESERVANLKAEN